MLEWGLSPQGPCCLWIPACTPCSPGCLWIPACTPCSPVPQSPPGPAAPCRKLQGCGQGSWIRATAGMDSVPGLGLWPGLGAVPSQALAWGLSGRAQGGVPAGIKVLLPCCSLSQRCPEREEDEGGSAQRGPALLHPAVPSGRRSGWQTMLPGSQAGLDLSSRPRLRGRIPSSW